MTKNLAEFGPDKNKKRGVIKMTRDELKHIATVLNGGRLLGRQLNLAGLVGVSSHGVVTKWMQTPASIPAPTVRAMRAMFYAATDEPAGQGGLFDFLQKTAQPVPHPVEVL